MMFIFDSRQPGVTYDGLNNRAADCTYEIVDDENQVLIQFAGQFRE